MILGERDPEAVRSEPVEIENLSCVLRGCLRISALLDPKLLDFLSVPGERQFMRHLAVSEMELAALQ